MKSNFTKLLKSKKVIYMLGAIILVVFGLALNAAFASFTSADTNEFMNAKVAGISYGLYIDGKQGTIANINPDGETIIDLQIEALEYFDTKYELTYEICDDDKCDITVSDDEFITVKKSNLSLDNITDIIPEGGNKLIKLIITNTSNQPKKILFKVNYGFAHNTLNLLNKITDVKEDDYLISHVLYQGGSILNIQELDQNKFENINSENGIYKILDNKGYSYYYRGDNNLHNNIIIEEKLFKIIRVNDDKSIRLIYSGNCEREDCTSFIDPELTSIYNPLASETKYIGFINEEDSLIKTNLENWLDENIIDKEILYKGSFCLNKELQSDISEEKTENIIYYGSRYKLEKNKTPSIRCHNKEDLIYNEIGLLTSNEASLAGFVYNVSNNNNYLSKAYNWWLLDPYSFDNTINNMIVTNEGKLFNQSILNNLYLRPVINIKGNIKITGDGSLNNPFQIV